MRAEGYNTFTGNGNLEGNLSGASSGKHVPVNRRD